MTMFPSKSFSSLFLVAGLSAVSVAVQIDLNVPTSKFDLPNLDPVVTGRLRLDTGGGSDSLLFKQPNPAGYPSADLLRGVSPWKGKATYKVSFDYKAANGLVTWSLQNGTVSGTVSFANAGSANNTLSYAFDKSTTGRTLPKFNILHVFMLADSNSTASFENLTFTAGTGLTTFGSVSSSGSVKNGSYDQWFAAGTGVDLGGFDWTMTADVSLELDGTRPSPERIKFEFTGKSGAYTPVPEPASMAVLGMGALALLRRKRS